MPRYKLNTHNFSCSPSEKFREKEQYLLLSYPVLSLPFEKEIRGKLS